MDCVQCGKALWENSNYCVHCGSKIQKPAGFWIRVAASMLDTLVFTPLLVINFLNVLSVKNLWLLLCAVIPGLLYKPFMESFYGATVGKKACGVKVVDAQGNKLTLAAAYLRFSPFLVSAVMSVAGTWIIFSNPEFRQVTDFIQLGELQQRLDPTLPLQMLFGWFIIIDCLFAAFTQRKRAIHDLLAQSFCVYA